MEAPLFLDDRRLRLLLFGGKGGVGKTTCATATALHFAQSHPQGHFLLVSTDPAHSLLDSIGDFAPPPNLKIVEFDAQQCLTVFKTEHHRTLKEIAKRGTFLDSEDINRFLDLSLPGMDEIMAILEISDWVQDTGYDCVLLDTAPTGHTRRLLAMPELMRKWLEALDALLAKHRYMKRLFSGSYQYDEPDQFLENLSVSLNRMETLLQDPLHCRFVPVMLAEELSIRETVDLLKELERLKVPVSEIVVNKLFPENSCLQCRNEHYHQMRRLKNFIRNNRFKQYAFWGVPLFPMEALGKGPLGSFWNGATKLKIPPLTPTLSPQGRGGSGRDSESPLAPVSGERVRACPVLDTGVRGQKGNSL